MDSAVMPKSTEADHALASRADERLAHAYGQIASADEQLARLTEKLKRMEQEPPRRPSDHSGQKTIARQAGAAWFHRPAGGVVHRRRRVRIAVVLWRSGKACHRMGGALCRFGVATGKAGACRAAGTIRRSPRCGGGRTRASNTFSSGRAAR